MRSRSDKEPRYSRKEVSNILYIGNLSYKTSEEQIEEAFDKFGKVNDVRISYNYNGTSKGFAYVEFSKEADASKAYKECSRNFLIDDREIRVDYDNKQKSSYSRDDYSPRYGGRGRDDSYDDRD